jgi:hypothetical protein
MFWRLNGKVRTPQQSSKEILIGRIVKTSRRCSETGKRYLAAYRRQSDGLYVFAWTEEVTEHGGGERKGEIVQNMDTGFADPRDCCLWCKTGTREIEGLGNVRVIFCSKCQESVCLGKTEGRWFQCWCGHRGYISDQPFAMNGFVDKPAHSERPILAGINYPKLTDGRS